MRYLFSLLGLSLLAVFAACSTSGSPDTTSSTAGSTSSSGGGSDAATEQDAGEDAPAVEADAGSDTGTDAGPCVPGDGVPGVCVAKRVTCGADCSAACDGRLTLFPSDDRYCTMFCATEADCAALGPNLACTSAVGACTPKCTTDAECTALGFARCEQDGGGCDTL
jgi:hypothetical protein